MSTNIHDMTHGNPAKLILTFGLPLMLGNLFQTAYTMVDSIIVGQAVGVNALAALGAADWLNWMMYGVVTGVTQGFGILYARRFGAKDERGLRRSIGTSLKLSIVIAVALTIVSLSLAKPLLQIMKTDSAILGLSYAYLCIVFSGLSIVMAYNFVASILRSLGNSKDPLIAMVIASGMNIGLDLLFVVVFRWGVEGAAIATLLAQCFAFGYCLKTALKIQSIYIQKEDFTFDSHYTKELLKLGLPLACMNIIIAIGGLVVQSVVNAYGISFVAGFTITNKLYALLEVAATSFGFSMATYVGQNSGAGNFERIRKGMRSANWMAIATSVCISVCMLIWGRKMIGIFIEESAKNKQEVIEIAYQYLKMMCYFLWVLYLLHVHRSALQGLSDTITPLVTSVVELIMRVVAVIVLPLFIGRSGVFYAEILAWSGSAIILIVMFQYRMSRIVK